MSPFWHTWWFEWGILICIGGSLLSLYFRRTKALTTEKAELEQQVKEQVEQVALLVEEKRVLCQKLDNTRQEVEKARLETQEANRARTVFLSTMSHEIRTPLNGVIGMTALLQETSLNKEQQDYTDTIRVCGESLLSVINNILDFSRLESGKLVLEQQDIDLRVCLEEVLDKFSAKSVENDLDLVYWIEPDVPAHVMIDGIRLNQVLMSLVDNAMKFTRQGEVFLSIQLLNAGADNEVTLSFQVRDTGTGISAAKVAQMFQAFSPLEHHRGHTGGEMGLGLAICEKLVKLMGGTIDVESQLGKGTIVTFSVRARKGTQSLISQTQNGMAGKQILIVDDNASCRLVMQNQLEQWALVPTLAESGHKALEVLSQKRDFDLVIADMVMPEMDGIKLAQAIKEKYPGLSILLVSSTSNERLKRQSNLFCAVLTKPIKQQLLSNHIFKCLKQPNQILVEPSHIPQKILSTSFSQRYPLRILIAEDNMVNQKLIVHILNKLGYQPGVALNGQAVLDAVSQENYQVILMDVQMPEMDGLEATRRLRWSMRQRLDIQPIIIATTANALPGDREECLQAGMDGYLSKPLQLEDIVKVLEKAALQLRNRQ
jgi:signal transduction histidine kinase/CheY-like chemotaxis protein